MVECLIGRNRTERKKWARHIKNVHVTPTANGWHFFIVIDPIAAKRRACEQRKL